MYCKKQVLGLVRYLSGRKKLCFNFNSYLQLSWVMAHSLCSQFSWMGPFIAFVTFSAPRQFKIFFKMVIIKRVTKCFIYILISWTLFRLSLQGLFSAPYPNFEQTHSCRYTTAEKLTFAHRCKHTNSAKHNYTHRRKHTDTANTPTHRRLQTQ